MTTSSLSHRRWRKYRAALLSTLGDTCYLCGQPVDKTLPGTHRDGPTIDHLTPRSKGGQVYDRNNCVLAHRHCNQSKNNNTLTPTNSRDW